MHRNETELLINEFPLKWSLKIWINNIVRHTKASIIKRSIIQSEMLIKDSELR